MHLCSGDMDVSLSQMAVVDAVARHGSFSRAARELHVGQPVVSRTIALVERLLGTALFSRTTRAVELTDAGRAYVAIARQVLAAAEHGRRQWEGYRSGERGSVTVAVLPSVAATVLPEAVREFTRATAGRSVTVYDVPADEGVALLKEGKADLTICDAEQAADAGPFVESQVLATDDLYAVLPPDSRLAASAGVTWADLGREPFVALRSGTGVRALTDSGFAAAGTAPQALVTARGVTTVAGLVAAGIGVSAVPASVLPLLGFQDLVFRPLTGPTVTRSICLLSRVPATLAARAFAQEVGAAFARRATEGPTPSAL
ncbi:LysR family transcriptional regulator [Streptomyces thermoviolaceus subsp. thermoviolaceus]|nr:LysR family transcriptional regulator [Streptomyces thermoviolaceus subsp. apingens]GHB11663.1 LysR family transcriptional regulator [Streptomyces thermoviolaceus subsp. thermoviolaceus]